jgi:DNA-binding phage protein
MRRDNLYRAFKGELKPAFDKVIKVLIALDIQLVAKPRRLVELGLKAKAGKS